MTTKTNTHFSQNWPWVTPHGLIYCNFSHIRSLGAAGAAGALAVDICICFHDTES